MSALRIDALPSEYDLERGSGGALALLREVAPALRAAGYGVDRDGELRTSALSGRKPLLELSTPAGVFLVRRFSHGGLLRFLTRARFRDPARPFRELAVSASIARRGLATPQVAAARARPAPGWGWQLEIVTRRIDGVIDLDELLARARAREVAPSALRRVARGVGRLVRDLHEAGCRHADLTTKNMLVDERAIAGAEAAADARAPRVWILDLDRASLVTRLSEEERRASLARLLRYVRRRELRSGPAIRATDWMRFLAGYEPDRARRKTIGRAVLAAHDAGLAWHRVGWRLERVFAGR